MLTTKDPLQLNKRHLRSLFKSQLHHVPQARPFDKCYPSWGSYCHLVLGPSHQFYFYFLFKIFKTINCISASCANIMISKSSTNKQNPPWKNKVVCHLNFYFPKIQRTKFRLYFARLPECRKCCPHFYLIIKVEPGFALQIII